MKPHDAWFGCIQSYPYYIIVSVKKVNARANTVHMIGFEDKKLRDFKLEDLQNYIQFVKNRVADPAEHTAQI